jgi:hypothetical protein
MADVINAPTMEMPTVETGSPSMDAGANGTPSVEYTFGTPEMGASPLSQEYIDGTTGDFTPDFSRGSAVDTQADALEGLPDTDDSVESSLSDLYKQFDENPDSLSDEDLDKLAEDENKKFAENQENAPTDNTGATNEKPVQSLDDLKVISSATGPAKKAETNPDQDTQTTEDAEQNDSNQTNTEETPATENEDPYAGKTREEVEEDLRKHNQREVEFGNIDQDEANRRTKEGLKDFDEKHPEEKSEYEKTTKGKLENLDNENEQIQQDLINNKISPIEAGKKLEKNNEARRKIIDELVNAKEKNERKLTTYEEKVAQKGAEIKKLMAEILYAPKIGKSMEDALKKIKDEFDEVKKFKVTEANANSDEAIKNVDNRDRLARAIAAQSTHMARYAKIISINVNEFKSANSELEELIGARSWGYNVVVQVGTSFVRGFQNIDVSATAKNIAKNGKMPR